MPGGRKPKTLIECPEPDCNIKIADNERSIRRHFAQMREEGKPGHLKRVPGQTPKTTLDYKDER